MKRITCFCLITLLLFSCLCAETKIIAHRGFSSKAPENTLPAFKKAIRSGADYFELDVHKTADDSVVVIHDRSIDRCSSNDMKGNIADMSYQELLSARLGYSEKFGKKFRGARLLTLKEALSCAKGRIKVCIEIKVPDIEIDVLKAVNDLNMNNEVIIFSFYYDVLKKIRSLDKNIDILYLRSVVDAETIELVKTLSGQAIGAGYKTHISPELLDLAHKNDIELWQWTVNKAEDMQRLLDIGADGIITNYPSKALILRKHVQK